MVKAKETKKKTIRYCMQDRIFYTIAMLVITLFTVTVLYPLVFVVSASFSTGSAVSAGKVVLLPVQLSVEGYEAVFRNDAIWQGYGNTILYTSLGTILNIAMCLICAYPMSRRDMPGRNGIMLIFTFTMYFSGGMIPSYILMRNLKLIDTMWVMIIPGALSVYNMILSRTFMQSSIPLELLEAATIDGCSDARYFFSIVLPLSKAIIAVIALYSAVAHWNAYFNAMLYLNTKDKMPLQIIMREILVANQYDPSMMVDPEMQEARAELADVLKYALIVVSSAPILCAYPFAQKYFVKGVMIGSLKG